jgi:death-on-curing protein
MGYTLLRLFLIQNGVDFTASQDNKYEFVIDIASGTLKYEGIVSWLISNTKTMNDR